MKKTIALVAIEAAFALGATFAMAGAQKTGGSSVANGGTGATTFTDGGFLLGSGADAVTATGRPTSGQLPIGGSAGDPVLGTITGTSNQITVTNGDHTITLSIPTSFTMTGSSPTFAQVTVSGGLTATGAMACDSTLDVDGNFYWGAATFRSTGTASDGTISFGGALTLATDLAVTEGGTGASTLTDGGILLGNGTGAIEALGVATNGQVPMGDGTTSPVLAAPTGTANQITVTLGAASQAYSIPSTFTMPASTPTFAQVVATNGLTGTASLATALAADPSDCTNQYATGIAASGNLTCAEVNPGYVSAGALASDVYVSSYAAGSIVNADINASAAIVDTKLATISTAGKVNGAALTGTAPVTFKLFSSADCNNLSAAATGQLCVDTSSWDLWLSTSVSAGGDYKKIGP